MSNYSPMAFSSRLAEEGEDLIVYRFSSGSLGFISPSEAQSTTSEPPLGSRGIWSFVKSLLGPRVIDRTPAVYVPPGARLILEDIPAALQKKFGVGPFEEVTFTQIATANKYRDAVRFRNGREVPLQGLSEGQHAIVLEMALKDADALVGTQHRRQVG